MTREEKIMVQLADLLYNQDRGRTEYRALPYKPLRMTHDDYQKAFYIRAKEVFEFLLSLKDDEGKPLIYVAHSDQNLPLDTCWKEAQQDMIKQGWRRVILPVGKEGT